MRSIAKLLTFFKISLIALFASCGQPKASPADAPVDAAAQEAVININVNVFLYSFDTAPQMSATFSDAEVAAAFAETNRIWDLAKIKFHVLAIQKLNFDASKFPAGSDALDAEGSKRMLSTLAPPRSGDAWNVIIFRKFFSGAPGAAGLYLAGIGTTHYTEINGKGETHYNILAHELGHALGLEHGTDPTNLMTPGMPEIALNLDSAQIATARAQAVIGPFGMR